MSGDVAQLGGPEAAGAVLLVTKGLDLGGVERIVVDLAVGLTRRGWLVEVAVVNERRNAFRPVLEGAGVRVHGLGGGDRIGVRALGRLAALVRRPRFAVVHVHGPLPAPIVRITARRRAAVVTTSHTPWESLHPATRAAWRSTARLDARSVAVSTAVASSLPERVGRRTVVIPHGVDPAVAARAVEAAGALADAVESGTVVAVAVASHRDAKNYPNLLRGVRAAIDLGVDVRLRAIGEGPGLDTHRRLAAELGVADAVAFEPPMIHVLDAIAAADLVVVASDFEGQPLVVAEALAVGVPVVATAVGRIPELVDPSVGLVVPTRDPEALGAAIAELANDPERRSEMSAVAHRVAAEWTLDDALDAHVSLYRSIVDRR